MSTIAVEGLTKQFPGDVRAVDGVDLTIEDGEFAVLVGPSGSGKSTVLRMVGGLELPTDGTIRIGDRVVNDLPPKARDIAMVFQDYALYPQMSVLQNMEFALKMKRQPKAQRRQRVRETAAMLGIDDLLERLPAQLSGGQRQRVAMGRAIVREPQAFLMDEPLSNLDAKLRVQMRAEIMRLHQRLGTTTMFVTHDQTEAMTMGQRIVVMRDGRTEQVDAPKRIYDEPANLFVGTFIGSPPMNVVRARLIPKNDRCYAHFGSHRLIVPETCFARGSNLRSFVGRNVLLGIRPESMEELQYVPYRDEDTRIEVEVALTEQMGAEVITHFKIDAPDDALDVMAQVVEQEDQASGGLDPAGLLTARLDRRTDAAAGKRVTLAVEVANLYFFDPADESAIC